LISSLPFKNPLGNGGNGSKAIMARSAIIYKLVFGGKAKAGRMTRLFHCGGYPRAVFNWMYRKKRSGTVSGAVATGSLAPGRYRSRQYRAATKAIKRIARHRTCNCNPL